MRLCFKLLLTFAVQSCWYHNSSQRPSAETVIEHLEDFMTSISPNKEMEHVAADETSCTASSISPVNDTSEHIRARDNQGWPILQSSKALTV